MGVSMLSGAPGACSSKHTTDGVSVRSKGCGRRSGDVTRRCCLGAPKQHQQRQQECPTPTTAVSAKVHAGPTVAHTPKPTWPAEHSRRCPRCERSLTWGLRSQKVCQRGTGSNPQPANFQRALFPVSFLSRHTYNPASPLPRPQQALSRAIHAHSSGGCVMFSFGEKDAPAKTAATRKKSRRVSLADRSRSRNDENAMPPSTPRGHKGLAGKGASLQTQQAFIQVRVWEWPTCWSKRETALVGCPAVQ